jgi:hypothetical protein
MSFVSKAFIVTCGLDIEDHLHGVSPALVSPEVNCEGKFVGFEANTVVTLAALIGWS